MINCVIYEASFLEHHVCLAFLFLLLLSFALSSLRVSDMPLLRLRRRIMGKGDNNINHKFTQYRSILLRPDANKSFLGVTINQIMEYPSLAYSFIIEEISHFHIIFLFAPQ